GPMFDGPMLDGKCNRMLIVQIQRIRNARRRQKFAARLDPFEMLKTQRATQLNDRFNPVIR
ncbi:MAG: hypothetical protein K0U34_00530, partial [Alphaproteobacteria bacterium]|nr:hypothetical protein [Alphaproteobacteria bacterium]